MLEKYPNDDVLLKDTKDIKDKYHDLVLKEHSWIMQREKVH